MRASSLRIAIALIVAAVMSACSLTPPESWPERLPAQVELTEVPFFAQEDYQCGPAALATVLHSAGVEVLPEQLTAEVYLPGRRGSLGVELIAATRLRDRLAYQLPTTLKAVLEELAAGRPVLVLQNLGFERAPVWHFAVLVGYDRSARDLILRSGTRERQVVSQRQFLRTWDRAGRWSLVVLEPGELPAEPDAERYLKAAASLEAVGRLDAAARAYRRARDQWPASAWPRLGLANISYARGDLRAAEEGYASALALDPNNVAARNNLAELLLGRGCIEQARSHIERAAVLAGDSALESAVAQTAARIAAADPDASSCVTSTVAR